MAKLFLAICILSLSVAASAARVLSANCDTFSLYNCLPYVTDDEYLTPTGPGDDCCADVSTILDNSPQCFCEALNEVLLYGVALNKTKGVGLPSACSLRGPKVGDCFDGVVIPDVSNSDSPAPAVAPWSPTEAPLSPPTGNSPSAAPPSPPVSSALSAPPSLSPAPSSPEPVPSPATGSSPVPAPAPENPAPPFALGSPAPARSGAQGLQSSLVVVLVTMAVVADSFVFYGMLA